MINKNGVICSTTSFLCISQTRMSKITNLNNFSSTKGIDLKLIPVTGLDNRRWFMTSSTLWRYQVCILQISYRKTVLVCKLHAWWKTVFNYQHVFYHGIYHTFLNTVITYICVILDCYFFHVLTDIIKCFDQQLNSS